MSATRAVSSPLVEITRLIPGYDPWENAAEFTFDEDAALSALEFFPACLCHVKGERGKPFALEPWQQAIVANLFGWKRQDGTRRYREAFIFVPRKNGKTTLVAGIVLYMLFCDGEPGAEIYSAAADREQAALVYEQAKGMMLAEPELASRGRINKTYRSITYEATGSSYKAISADADTKHGFNTHCAIIDELHAQPNRNLVDVLMTSTGSRKQPLIVHITTSDFDRESICNEKHFYASGVRDGLVEDSSFLPVIYEADPKDDWTSTEVWAKANPNLGVSVSVEYLDRECQRAQHSPAYLNTFLRLHLNMRTQQDVRWIPPDEWDQCVGEVDPVALEGEVCFGGLDLASTTDIAALVLVFPTGGSYKLLPFFWIAEECAKKREAKNNNVSYVTWARAGLIELTEGNVIDYDVIRQRINGLRRRYNIRKIAVDRWNAQQITSQLEGDGFKMEMFGQGFASMSAPSKEFERAITGRQLEHGGNKVLRWMVGNVSAEMDAAGNIKPSRKKSTEKIDGVVAAIMGIGVANQNVKTRSKYEDGDLVVL